MMSLYTISEGPFGPTKIGITENTKLRGSALQVGNPRSLTFGLSLPCPHATSLERRVHKFLAAHRMCGEWFNISPKEAEVVIGLILKEGCGIVEGQAVKTKSDATPAGAVMAKASGATAGETAQTKRRKSGRPLSRDRAKSNEATKPWESEGLSRTTWYRRQQKS